MVNTMMLKVAGQWMPISLRVPDCAQRDDMEKNLTLTIENVLVHAIPAIIALKGQQIQLPDLALRESMSGLPAVGASPVVKHADLHFTAINLPSMGNLVHQERTVIHLG